MGGHGASTPFDFFFCSPHRPHFFHAICADRVGDAVAELTRSAMGGNVPFHEALAARLAIMRPSRTAVDAFLAVRRGTYLFVGLMML